MEGFSSDVCMCLPICIELQKEAVWVGNRGRTGHCKGMQCFEEERVEEKDAAETKGVPVDGGVSLEIDPCRLLRGRSLNLDEGPASASREEQWPAQLEPFAGRGEGTTDRRQSSTNKDHRYNSSCGSRLFYQKKHPVTVKLREQYHQRVGHGNMDTAVNEIRTWSSPSSRLRFH